MEESTASIARQVEEESKKKVKTSTPLSLTTGSVMLNLALSDRSDAGVDSGTFVNIVGDHSAGKTFLLWHMFAEAAYNKAFDKYDIYYDEPEVSLKINIPLLFGEKVEKRVKRSICSYTVQDFHDNVMTLAQKGKPFILGLDSWDGLTSDEEIKKEAKKGGYMTEGATVSGRIFRKAMSKISETNSYLIVISQTRDNIGVMFGPSKTRSGGNAMHFWNSHELWMAVASHMKRTYRSKEIDVGINARVAVKKNKLTGKLREAEFPIYFDFGIDDITSMINWMVSWKFWTVETIEETGDDGKPKKVKGAIDTKGDFISAKIGDLISHIESQKLVPKLTEIVSSRWREIEDAISTGRKNKYQE